MIVWYGSRRLLSSRFFRTAAELPTVAGTRARNWRTPVLGATITGIVAANGGSVVDVMARAVIAPLLSGLRNLGLFT